MIIKQIRSGNTISYTSDAIYSNTFSQ